MGPNPQESADLVTFTEEILETYPADNPLISGSIDDVMNVVTKLFLKIRSGFHFLT